MQVFKSLQVLHEVGQLKQSVPDRNLPSGQLFTQATLSTFNKGEKQVLQLLELVAQLRQPLTEHGMQILFSTLVPSPQTLVFEQLVLEGCMKKSTLQVIHVVVSEHTSQLAIHCRQILFESLNVPTGHTSTHRPLFKTRTP